MFKRARDVLLRLTRDASRRWLPQGYFTRKEFAAEYGNQGADHALRVLVDKGFITPVDHDTIAQKFQEYRLNVRWYCLTPAGWEKLLKQTAPSDEM